MPPAVARTQPSQQAWQHPRSVKSRVCAALRLLNWRTSSTAGGAALLDALAPPGSLTAAEAALLLEGCEDAPATVRWTVAARWYLLLSATWCVFVLPYA